MTRKSRISNRPTPTVNETIYASKLDNYLRGARYHPAIAHILAYQKSIKTNPKETHNGNQTGTNPRPHL